MSRLNHRKLLATWDTIIMQLCEEVTTHDVLGVIMEYISLVEADCRKNKIDSKRFKECLKHLEKARSAVNPER